MPKADKIAAAVLEWAKFNGATSFCHWFQPIASTFRHGQSGQVQNAMFKWDKKNQPVWDLEVIHLAFAVRVAVTVSSCHSAAIDCVLRLSISDLSRELWLCPVSQCSLALAQSADHPGWQLSFRRARTSSKARLTVRLTTTVACGTPTPRVDTQSSTPSRLFFFVVTASSSRHASCRTRDRRWTRKRRCTVPRRPCRAKASDFSG